MFTQSLKTFFIALLIMASIGNAWPAAAVSSPQGCYGMDGKISINLDIPSILTVKLSSPHMSVIGLETAFNADQSFVMAFPLLSSLAGGLGEGIALPSEIKGTWAAARRGNFTVETELVDLIGQLQELGLNANVTSHAFTGVASNNGAAIRGAFNLGVSVDLQQMGKATLAIKGAYAGKSQECAAITTAKAVFPSLQALDNGMYEDIATPKPSVTELTLHVFQEAVGASGAIQAEALHQAVRKVLTQPQTAR
jgi:hypothetical protein